jgi:RNA polymerase sigma-70 factor (ECF subfamily)
MSDDDDAYARGRAAWPAIELPRDAFACASPAHAEDAYLAQACARGLAPAIAAFETRFVPEIDRFLAGVERDPAVVAEVRQLVRARLLVGDGGPPRIGEYAGAGRLGSWLRVVTVRVHANHLRGRRVHVPFDEADHAPLLIAPELAALRERHRADLEAALRLAFEALPARDRTLLRFHYLDGLTLEQLAAMYAVHRATVARWLAAARERVVDAAAAELRTRIGIADDELSSWLGLLQSGLDVSLSGILRA